MGQEAGQPQPWLREPVCPACSLALLFRVESGLGQGAQRDLLQLWGLQVTSQHQKENHVSFNQSAPWPLGTLPLLEVTGDIKVPVNLRSL